jgi:hypothetical protein
MHRRWQSQRRAYGLALVVRDVSLDAVFTKVSDARGANKRSEISASVRALLSYRTHASGV